MKFLYRIAALMAMAASAAAQTGATANAPAREPVRPSALDAQLFYQLLVGELQVSSGEPGVGYSLMLDAARKARDEDLYQRAVEIALQARSGDAALQAARAWKQAFPESREANRHVLQILLALNRLDDVAEPLQFAVAATPQEERGAAITMLPRLFVRAQDRKLAAQVVEQALSDALRQPATAAAAWSTIGRMRLLAGDVPGALDAARRGEAADRGAEGPALLALEMMDPAQPEAEALVNRYLAGKPQTEVRLAYARALLDNQRLADARAQLQRVTAERPDLAEAWLVLGTLQAQDNQLDAAEAALQRYLDLANQRTGEAQEAQPGKTQAYLVLAELAEKRGNYALAERWLDRIDNAGEIISAQSRRASVLARQGRLNEARALLRALPERNAGDARTKLMAEVQLLREHKQPRLAYELLGEALARDPQDSDLLYERALLAEKLGLMEEMERLLRQLIAARPDYQHAYNALGYSLAERNIRLPEARELVRKALELAPGDPFIQDSLAWVEFRMGNKAEALRILEGAYKARPDAEIAAHLGEVLWSMDQRDRARAIWREGLLVSPGNETLTETLRRLRVRP